MGFKIQTSNATGPAASTGPDVPTSSYQSPLDSGVLVLSDAQYEHFEACMTHPDKPSQMMVDAAVRIQEFARKHR